MKLIKQIQYIKYIIKMNTRATSGDFGRLLPETGRWKLSYDAGMIFYNHEL